MQSNIKNRKSSRLTAFDSIRNLPSSVTPLPTISEAKLKAEHRRQQLEKWKAEKEEKKKQQEMQKKKKPFLTGVVRAPLRFEPPPPPKSSTSGRVTRSQTRSTIPKPRSPKLAKSFAPRNATFTAPHIKTLDKFPILSQSTKNKYMTKPVITFDPVAPNVTAKLTRSKTQTRQIKTDIKNTRKSLVETGSTRGTTKMVTKNASKSSRFTNNPQSSSSSSDIDSSKIKRVKTPGRNKTSIPIHNRPKALVFESTTDGTSSDNLSQENINLKYSIISVNSSATESEKGSSETDSSLIDSTVIRRSTRKSCFLPKPLSPRQCGLANSSSEMEFASEIILVKNKHTRKSLPSTPSMLVPKSESDCEQKLRSPKSPIDLVLTPKQIQMAKMSPRVTLSRGKDNARKEAQWKMQEGNINFFNHFRYKDFLF